MHMTASVLEVLFKTGVGLLSYVRLVLRAIGKDLELLVQNTVC